MPEAQHLDKLLAAIEDPSGRKTWIEHKMQQDSMDLSGADLSGKDLRDFDFSDVNLAGATFFGANLTGADFSDSECAETDFRRATLSNCCFDRADLTMAQFQGAVLSDATIEDANLCEAKLQGADLVGAEMGGSDLGDADLRSASLKYANLTGARVNGANVAEADLTGSVMDDEAPSLLRNFDLAVVDDRRYRMLKSRPKGNPKSAGNRVDSVPDASPDPPPAQTVTQTPPPTIPGFEDTQIITEPDADRPAARDDIQDSGFDSKPTFQKPSFKKPGFSPPKFQSTRDPFADTTPPGPDDDEDEDKFSDTDFNLFGKPTLTDDDSAPTEKLDGAAFQQPASVNKAESSTSMPKFKKPTFGKPAEPTPQPQKPPEKAKDKPRDRPREKSKDRKYQLGGRTESAPLAPKTKDNPLGLPYIGSDADVQSDEGCARILNVRVTSSQTDITKAFRARAKQLHPDKVRHMSEEIQKLARDQFEFARRAHDILKRKSANPLDGVKLVKGVPRRQSPYEYSIKELSKLVKVNPSNEHLFFAMGMKYYEDGMARRNKKMMQEAETAFVRVLDLNARNTDAEHNLKAVRIQIAIM